MPGATSNRVDLAYIAEVDWGVTPATPALQEIRFTGESLDMAITTETSQEIRSDRAETDLIPVDASVSGGVQFELSYGTYDDWLAALAMSAWVDPGATGEMTTVVAATDNLVATTADEFEDVIIGQVIELSGFTAPGLNRRYRVVGKADNETLSLFPQPSDAEVGAAVTLAGEYLVNGVTEQSFSIVKRFNDATPVTTRLFTGKRIGSMTLELATATRITGEFSFLGKTAVYGVDPAVAGETRVDATTTPIMNSVTNIDSLLLDGTNLCATGELSNLSVSIDNQHREQKGLCQLGNVGVRAGKLMVTLSGSQYFTNADEAAKFEASTAFSFSYALEDSEGNFYDFNFPRCKYESYTVVTSGTDTDIMADVSFRALRDPLSTHMFIISRLAA